MKGLKFRPDGRDYEAGDERAYDVVWRGVTVGTVEACELPYGEREGDFRKGWVFTGRDGVGEGWTRAAAVEDAFNKREETT